MKELKSKVDIEALHDAIIMLRWGKLSRKEVNSSCYSYRVIS